MRPPLKGIIVIDMSRVLTGPYAAMMLGDLGARVIKVERTGTGDETRLWGPPFVGTDDARTSTYFLSVNRNKESIALDLKKPADLKLLMNLIREADVLIENFRVGVMDGLGLGFEELKAINERLIILSITGFGHDGPDSGRAGYDQIAQGEAGLMSMTGPDRDHPTRIGIPISDILAGIFGAYGVVAALYRRQHTGMGDVVRTSLLAASIAAHTFQGTRWLMANEVATPIGNSHPTLVPYQTFRCRDGFLQLAVGNDQTWQRCAPLLGLDLSDSRYRTNAERVANRELLITSIEKTLLKGTVSQWLETFQQHRVPAGRVKSLDEVYSDPQVLSQGIVLETKHPRLGYLRLPGCPIRFDKSDLGDSVPPPLLDEHGDLIRRWLQDRNDERQTEEGRSRED
jgi:crotonobetainyl-CoA:carnitine CoA-transferase CaiB-like acyl-CoA transferase